MRVDEDFLDEIGFGGMPEEEKREFAAHAEEELEVRVGQEIGRDLTVAQMTEFESLKGDAATAKWLEKNVPDFRERVKAVFEAFKRELQEEKATILG